MLSNSLLRELTLEIAEAISPFLRMEIAIDWGVFWRDQIPGKPQYSNLHLLPNPPGQMAATEYYTKTITVNPNYLDEFKKDTFCYSLQHPQDRCIELVLTHELTHVELTPSREVKMYLAMFPSLADLLAHDKKFYDRLLYNWTKVKASL
jgi:hypothetical protein